MKKDTKKLLFDESLKTFIGSIGLICVAAFVFRFGDSKLIDLQNELKQKEQQQQIQFDLANQLIEYASLLYQRSSSLSGCADHAKLLRKENVGYEIVIGEIDDCYENLQEIDKKISKHLLLGAKATQILDPETALLFADLGRDAYRSSYLGKMKKIDALRISLADKERLAKLTINDWIKADALLAAEISVMDSDLGDLKDKFVKLVGMLKAKGYLGE